MLTAQEVDDMSDAALVNYIQRQAAAEHGEEGVFKRAEQYREQTVQFEDPIRLDPNATGRAQGLYCNRQCYQWCPALI